MRNTLYDGYQGPRMTRRMLKKRLMNAIDHELTDRQKRVVMGYYLENRNIVELAQEYGVNKSTVWRTLKRGEDRLRRCLRY